MAIFYQISIAFLVSAIEILFVLFKGYFLSIEFTLYPYLVSHGFIPYKNILDQHFPSLFFGTFSLPLLSTTSLTPLLLLLLLVIITSNFLLLRYLILSKTTNSSIWFILYVVLTSYFSVNILWVEIFINLFLLIIINLNLKRGGIASFIIGLLVSQIILLRPTLLPSILFFGLFIGLSKELILGIVSGLFLSLLHLVANKSLNDFIDLAIRFNFSSYAKSGSLYPAYRQVAVVVAIFSYSIFSFLSTRNWKLFGAVALSLLAIFPRFGLEHLQPFILFTVLLASMSKSKKNLPEYFLIVLVSSLLLVGLARNRYGNYFYNPEVINQAEKLKSLPFQEIYLFGASDLLYPLSGKLPTGNLYIPSLPWYLNYPKFQNMLITTLKKSNSFVIVDTLFTVDGQKLINSSPKIYEFIKMNYNLIDTSGRYEVYSKKL